MFSIEKYYQDPRFNVAALVNDRQTIHVDDNYYNEIQDNPLTRTAIMNAQRGTSIGLSQFISKLDAHIRYCQNKIVELQQQTTQPQ